MHDVARARGADPLEFFRAAHPGPVGFENLGDLHGKRPDATRSAVDQDFLAGLDLALIAKKLEGGRGGHTNGRGLLNSEVGGLQHEMACWSARVLGESPGTPTEHLISRLEI